MGTFKKMHQDILEAFPAMLQEEAALIKESNPHIRPEAAKLMALDTAIPMFFMYALKVMEPKQQESPKKKENKNVKRRPAKKEQSTIEKNQLKFTDIT